MFKGYEQKACKSFDVMKMSERYLVLLDMARVLAMRFTACSCTQKAPCDILVTFPLHD